MAREFEVYPLERVKGQTVHPVGLSAGPKSDRNPNSKPHAGEVISTPSLLAVATLHQFSSNSSRYRELMK